MYNTGYFKDVVTDKYRKLNKRTEIDYFYSVVIGEVFYSKGHSHCKGYPGSIGNNPMDQLLVTESLTVVNKKVTIREDFRTGDMIVLEHGAYLPSPHWQGEEIVTEFGTLLLNRRQVPCQWKKERNITAARVEKFSGVEIGLVDEVQHLYFPIFDQAFTAPNCPTSYWWTETKDVRVRVVREVHKESDKKEQFEGLTEERHCRQPAQIHS